MRCFWIVLSVVALCPLQAAEPPGLAHWSGSALKALEQKLAPRINAQKLATEQLGSFGNHSVLGLLREASGEAEIHETQVDVFVVQGGEANLVGGGTVVGARNIAPGETRGTSIEGGETKKLAPGDMVHIPANLPHQVLIEPGKKFTYVIVKIDSK